VIYIDDCSTDGTTEKLRQLVKLHPFLRHVLHKRNMGESAGTLTGIEAARGSLIVTMDADLQNDPADIPKMLKLMRRRRADAVCGVRGTRNDSLGKRLSSRAANAIRGWLLDDGIHDAGCTFRILRKSALRQLVAFKATHRFLPTMMKWHGYKVIEMTINHRPRTRGVSKYGFGNRFWVGILDILGMAWYRRRLISPDRVAGES
jgi:glycosyltransferase involved in cell wall biosynthesis